MVEENIVPYRSHECSEETRKKISLANMHHDVSEETKRKISLAKIGKPGHIPSAETREKLRKANRGKKLTKEHRQKLSLAKTGCPGFWQGKKRSAEDRKLMSVGHIKNPTKYWLGKKLPPDMKEKCSKSYFPRGHVPHNYRGGVTPESARIRSGLEYKLWRTAVFQRDNFTCQKSGIKGGSLVAHHIRGFADYPELRTSIENGTTLSKDAHTAFHRKYGRNHNTREQLEEFLKP